MSTDTDGFFTGACRGDYLDALSGHAAQGATVVLEGDEGSGVSALLGQAAMALLEGKEVVRVDGAQSHGPALVIDALLKHFSIERDQLADTLKDTLAHQRLVVIADNAQEISDAALGTMKSLKTKLGSRVAYLFGGLPGAAEAIKGADLDVDDVLDLPLLDEADVKAFSRVTGGAQLSDDEAAQLCEQSDGLPGPLLYLLDTGAHSALTAEEDEDVTVQEGNEHAARALPWQHIAAVLGLLVLVAILWAAFSGGDDPEETSSREVALPQPDTTSSPNPSAEEGGDQGVAPMERSMEPVARLEELTEPEDVSEADETQEQAKADGQASVETASEEAAQTSAEKQDKRPEQGAPSVAPQEEPINKANSAEAADTSKPTAPPETKSGDQDYPQAHWLQQRDDSDWFLQITATSREEGARRILDELDRQGAYYPATRNGKSVFVVVAGAYPSRQAALDARPDLPENLRQAGPFPRNMAAIREEL